MKNTNEYTREQGIKYYQRKIDANKQTLKNLQDMVAKGNPHSDPNSIKLVLDNIDYYEGRLKELQNG